MTVLGLSAGNRGGSAEILLKEALRAAERAGATVQLVRVDDLNLSIGPGADAGRVGADVTGAEVTGADVAGADDAGADVTDADDAQWFWDRLMESDAVIVSSPIYTRTIPGKLRLLGDKISGPQADVAFTAEILRMRAAGEAIPVQFAIDERVLRPRVAGFMAVGGSLVDYWKTLALPLMHTLTASAQIGIVDQAQFAGAGSPASIVLDAPALERARELGRNVAAQAGTPFDEVVYRGAPGVCPLCHLSVIVLDAEGAGAECATCGARGTVAVEGGRASVSFTPDGLRQSVMSMHEKFDHFREVQQTAARHAPLRADIDDRARAYDEYDPSIRPPR